MTKALTAEVARIRALARMAREEGVAELTAEGVSFKLEPRPAPVEKEPVPEEIEPVESVARDMEEAMGLPVDRGALREFLGPVPQKKGRA